MSASTSTAKRAMSRGVSATIEDHGDECRVWFSARDSLRHILLSGLQDKGEFLALVRKSSARVDLFVDGQAYVMKKTYLPDFLAASEDLVLRYVPEIGE